MKAKYILAITYIFLMIIASGCKPPTIGTIEEAPTIEAPKTQPDNLSSNLFALYESWNQDPSKVLQDEHFSGIDIKGNRIKVTITAFSAEEAEKMVNNPEFTKYAEVTAHFGTLVDAWVAIPDLLEISKLPGIAFVQEAVAGEAPSN